MTGKVYICSFCGKNNEQVLKVITGPKAAICDECIDLSYDIVHGIEKRQMIIRSPNIWTPSYGNRAIFIAGGIRNVPDWQTAVAERIFQETNLTPLNPRRDHFTPEMHVSQIEWEHKHLAMADVVMFYFTKETLCPITLLEYGKNLVGPKKIFVAVEAGYSLTVDIIEQTRRERPQQKVWGELESMIDEIVTWSKNAQTSTST